MHDFSCLVQEHAGLKLPVGKPSVASRQTVMLLCRKKIGAIEHDGATNIQGRAPRCEEPRLRQGALTAVPARLAAHRSNALINIAGPEADTIARLTGFIQNDKHPE
ncbi:hypothetical protein [Massilia genomosp. 1]|nr:hypothetical protein [Massilia genomosp. 1]